MRLLLIAITVLVALSRAFSRYEVEGASMTPTFAAGQRLVVNRLAVLLRPPVVGEVVVVRRAGAGGRLDLKRVSAGPGEEVEVRGENRKLGPDEWFVLGDNEAESTDSRHLGPVRRRDIHGVVWFSY